MAENQPPTEMETKDSGNNLTAAELKAIEEHKYYLSQKRGVEVTIEEAIADFIQNIAEAWRKEKLRRDNLEQRQEIERHKYLRSMQEGRDIGKSSAAEEWCQKYAHIWRAERESLERNGFKTLLVTVQNEEGLHLRPVSSVAELASKFDCDIYVHRQGMTYYNFLLEGCPYMNVRSILGLLSLGTALGDKLEFIATGSQAEQALQALKELLTERKQ
ncbi:MAG TPA: HPr family phosphocarrier protein [Verrucomicrobiae bacterium]|nr:HPr family phosphocarrier protein [Verrucomicrobiae bacterium]